MAGGVGTRFWPMSRKASPKQLLGIVESKSMLRLTYERIRTLTTPEKILVITNEEQKDVIKKQLNKIPETNIIAEPFGRNTAPCIGLAGAIIKAREEEDQIMVVLPADHLISNALEFREIVKVGVEYVQKQDCLMTLGIQPKNPETGYGYIQKNNRVFRKKGKEIFKVKTFAEKPNLETAQRFLKSGDFLWNSGMFIWSVSRIMKEFDEYLPELAEDLSKIQKAVNNKNFKRIITDVYSRTRSISIDYAVMERAKNVCVIHADFNWNDLGSWEAVYNISPKDKHGNVVHSKDSILLNSKNNYFYSKKKLVTAVDIEDLVIVDMDDALLICKKESSQKVKMIVEYLSRKDRDSYL
jgi:mannose-1-phosphate guanylyltransferase